MTLSDRLSRTTRRRITLVTWLVATAFAVVAVRAIGWRKAIDALSRANPWWVAAAIVANLAIVALWAWQSMVFLPDERRIGYGRAFEVTAISTAATNTTPAGLGEAAGIAALAERGGVGGAVALSVFTQHHLVEGFAKLGSIVLAAHFAPLPPWVRQSLVGLSGLVTIGTVGLFLLASRAARLVPATLHDASSRAARARAFVWRWAASLVALRSPSRFTLGLAIAIAMKGAEALGWLAVQHAFGLSLGAGVPVMALTAVNLASTVSATPGNVGMYEGAAYFVYVRQGVAPDTAFAVALTGHVCYLVALVGAGWAVLGRALVRRRYGEADGAGLVRRG